MYFQKESSQIEFKGISLPASEALLPCMHAGVLQVCIAWCNKTHIQRFQGQWPTPDLSCQLMNSFQSCCINQGLKLCKISQRSLSGLQFVSACLHAWFVYATSSFTFVFENSLCNISLHKEPICSDQSKTKLLQCTHLFNEQSAKAILGKVVRSCRAFYACTHHDNVVNLIGHQQQVTVSSAHQHKSIANETDCYIRVHQILDTLCCSQHLKDPTRVHSLGSKFCARKFECETLPLKCFKVEQNLLTRKHCMGLIFQPHAWQRPPFCVPFLYCNQF